MRRAVLLVFLGGALSSPLPAQDNPQRQLRESQLRLDQIRQEKAQLQEEMGRLRGEVRNVSGELENIERQRAASDRILRELDVQSTALAASIDETSQDLLQARERLRQRSAVLQLRLRSIYKRGPLHTARVLLTAESFGNLLNRAKYLHLVAERDRRLIAGTREIERNLAAQERELQESLAQLQRLQIEKAEELAQLEGIREEHRRTLRQAQQREEQAEDRLTQLVANEVQLTDAVGEQERTRRESERRSIAAGGPATSGVITTRDLGTLEWPLEGRVVYRFGLERRPNGTTLRWNGIGIAAPPGTDVKSVESGSVVMARPFEGYGPTVMISHGGGYYTLYLYLSAIRVREGQRVATGEVIGTVGGEGTPEGAHIEFQVRAPVRGGSPQPVDPLVWLRSRSRG